MKKINLILFLLIAGIGPSVVGHNDSQAAARRLRNVNFAFFAGNIIDACPFQRIFAQQRLQEALNRLSAVRQEHQRDLVRPLYQCHNEQYSLQDTLDDCEERLETANSQTEPPASPECPDHESNPVQPVESNPPDTHPSSTPNDTPPVSSDREASAPNCHETFLAPGMSYGMSYACHETCREAIDRYRDLTSRLERDAAEFVATTSRALNECRQRVSELTAAIDDCQDRLLTPPPPADPCAPETMPEMVIDPSPLPILYQP